MQGSSSAGKKVPTGLGLPSTSSVEPVITLELECSFESVLRTKGDFLVRGLSHFSPAIRNKRKLAVHNSSSNSSDLVQKNGSIGLFSWRGGHWILSCSQHFSSLMTVVHLCRNQNQVRRVFAWMYLCIHVGLNLCIYVGLYYIIGYIYVFLSVDVCIGVCLLACMCVILCIHVCTCMYSGRLCKYCST